MDNAALEDALLTGASRLGVRVDPASAERLIRFEEELFRWNSRVNLVGRSGNPLELLEKHLLDSIAAAPEIAAASTLLDIGAGAGFPGVPLKVVEPRLDVTLVDSMGKKVAFMRHAIAKLQLGPGIRVQQVRARGWPDEERLPRVEVAISRALLAAPEWLKLGFAYVVPAGRVIAMLAQVEDSVLTQAAAKVGASVLSVRRYELPLSGAPRAIAVFQRRSSGE